MNNFNKLKKDFDIKKVRQDFPIITDEMHFLDSAASTQKPKVMIDALKTIYETHYANVHRGIYQFSEKSTALFEETRIKIASFIGANSSNEIIFTKGATESINIIATSYARQHLIRGDEVIISELEHHANIVPWQNLAKEKGIVIKVIPINGNGEINIDAFKKLIGSRTKIVSILHTSNALGVVTPIEEIIKITHENKAKIIVDACQSIVHNNIDVLKLDIDFLVFSAHKLYGPNGVGVLYGKYNILKQMSPYQFGGEMILEVDLEKGTTYQDPPLRFEAGTPAIAEVIAFGKVIDYISMFDRLVINQHESELACFLRSEISKMDNYQVIGASKNMDSIVSFVHNNAHASDIGTILDNMNIAIRTGHHCAQPLMKRLNISGTARASIAMYNNHNDVEALIKGLHKINKMFSG